MREREEALIVFRTLKEALVSSGIYEDKRLTGADVTAAIAELCQEYIRLSKRVDELEIQTNQANTKTDPNG